MNKDALIIAHFTDDFDNKGNNRFNYLADILSKNQLNVELITSDFSHVKKEKRSENIKGKDYKVTLIPEPAYKRNLSIKRLYSHYIMAKNLKEYLINRKIPDVIYCAVPSLDLALVATKYANKHNVKLIIDVQDLWPEAYKLIIKSPIFANVLFFMMNKKANYIYAAADEIIAVSETYGKRALSVNTKCDKFHNIFLGTELSKFDEMASLNKFQEKPKDEIWLAYAGTLGHNYDLTSVIDALAILKDRKIKDIKLIVLGDGPLKDRFEKYSAEKHVNSFFTGRLEYEKMVGILSVCDIAVNPITNSAASIINKHADYAAAGLPVVNTQESMEYRTLVQQYKMGLNCINNDPIDLAEKILTLYKNPEMREEMGKNSRDLAEEKFDRSKTYPSIVKLLNTKGHDYEVTSADFYYAPKKL